MEGWKEGEEAPGTMSSHDSTEAVDKMSCADDRPVQAEKRIEGTTGGPTFNTMGATGGTVDTSNVAAINLGVMCKTLFVTIPDHLHELLERTKEKIERDTTGMVRVSAVDDVLKKMKFQRWITITGNAGDGKTVLGYLVLKELQEDVGVFTISEPKEYEQIAKMKENKVIMFDDRFGAFLADQQLIKKWFDVIEEILKDVEGENPKVKVIFISRKNVVNESTVSLGRLKIIFDKECVIDLSERKLTDERLKILEYHLRHEAVTVDPETKARVCNREVAHGFPHCCKMFSKLKSKGFDAPIEEFFKSPLEFLDMTTKVLYNETCRNLFQLMIKNDGKLNVNDIADVDERQALLRVEKEQEGSYITRWRNGICQFAHPSVYESVLNVINDIDPLYCVQYATLSVIRQKMIISTSDEEDSNRAPCYIIVKSTPAVLEALAERFREEILEGDYSVFTHRLCQSMEFCEALVSGCVCNNENEHREEALDQEPIPHREEELDQEPIPGCCHRFLLCSVELWRGRNYIKASECDPPGITREDKGSKQFINQRGKNGDTMMWTALRGGRMAAVHSLVEAGADVNIKRSGRTALHYLCQLRESGVRDDDGEGDIVDIGTMRLIITEGGGDCNIPDQFGRTALHYLCELNSTDDQQLVVINALRLFITEGKGDLNLRELNKSTPLHYLCAYSGLQLDTVDLVINEGKGDLNKGDEHGTTPFHYLCENGRVDFNVKLRITNTAKGDINKQDDNGITPLHVLCKGTLPMKDVLTLIKEGDKADMYGNTPLHFLCRRRGISDEEIQQLKQLAESHMKKRNDLGNTPLDYLNDQDDRLPWTDGMIARSVADLVLCRVKHGDTSTIVLGRAMILNSERVHSELQVEGRELNNMAESRDRETPNQFKRFRGTCSSPIPLPPSPSPISSPSYWETQCQLGWRERGGLLLEMGVKEGRGHIDGEWFVSLLPRSVCVSVVEDDCRLHTGRFCIKVMRKNPRCWKGYQVGECVTLPRPTPGELTFTFGLVLDVGRGRVGIVDVERGKLLCKIDKVFTQEVFPMFCVNRYNNYCATRMRLVSGREISVTDSKIKLIQQALSD